MKKQIEALVTAWNESRKMTMELSQVLSVTQLHTKQSRPGLNTIGMHLLEMADVTMSYAESFKTGKLSFGRVKDTYPEDMQKKSEVAAALNKSSEEIEKSLKTAKPEMKISAFGEEVSLFEMLLTLIRHENMHHGQIIAFAYASGIPMPQSWYDNWALPKDE